MGSIFKLGRDKKRPGSPYRYEFKDENGNPVRRRGCADKGITQQMLTKAETEVAKRKAGLIDPETERRSAETKRPIAEHLADYEKHMSAKSSVDHVEETLRGIRGLVEACEFDTLADLSAATAENFLQSLRNREKRPIGHRAYNKRLKALKSWATWLVNEGRLTVSPFNHLPTLNKKTDVRHARRALSPAEVTALIQTTATGPDRYGLSGLESALIYQTALGTGFRRNELASLTPESFEIDAKLPVIVVKAAYTKNRKPVRQPINKELVAILKGALVGRTPGETLWEIPADSAKMIRAALEAAGCSTNGSDGKVVDFHCLRHTFITRLTEAGLHPKQAQELARHSKMDLTMNHYTHLTITDLAASLEGVPNLTVPTDQGAPNEHPPVSTSQWISQCANGSAGRRVSSHVNAEARQHSGDDARKPHSHNDLRTKKPSHEAREGSEAEGTRTLNLRIDSPVHLLLNLGYNKHLQTDQSQPPQ